MIDLLWTCGSVSHQSSAVLQWLPLQENIHFIILLLAYSLYVSITNYKLELIYKYFKYLLILEIDCKVLLIYFKDCAPEVVKLVFISCKLLISIYQNSAKNNEHNFAQEGHLP